MSQYRKRFVQFNMLLIGIVLTVMVGIVEGYMVRDYYTGLRVTMEQVLAPLRSFSQMPDGKQQRPNQSRPERRDPGAEKDILTLFYSPEDGSFSVLSSSESFLEENIPTLAQVIISQEQDFGTLYQFHAIYYRSGSNPYKIAVASTDYITHSVLSLTLVLLGIWAGAMFVFFIISVKLSGIAARPMEEAILREKQFVADASHDLKTPLSVILANTSILRENPEAKVGSLGRWLDSTQTAAKRMQQLIGQMLTLAEVERPDAAVAMETVDLANLAMKAALEIESLAYEKNVTLDTSLPDSCLVRGNGDYLLRIVSSLLENALKYEPSGGRVLLMLRQEKRKAILQVQNFGSCISEESLPHVFDRFYRGDQSRQNETGSFGLGLAITWEMTEKLGARITAESSPQGGTVFRVAFGHGKD